MAENETTSSSGPVKRTHPLILLLLGVVPAAVVGFVMYQNQVQKPTDENKELNSALVYNLLGLKDAAPLKLSERFVDSNGDLVAETPADAKEIVDPQEVVFSYVATTDPETYRDRFKEFVDFLSKQIGRPVKYELYHSPEAEVKAMREGKLHVAGINTGNIPLVVNECGFVPICMLAGEQGGSTYQMQVIVPADSPIRKLSDLKGHELTLTEPGSNSGFKAPLVLLSKDNNLQPGKDFAIRYSGGHNESIVGIANKTYQAAAIASDVLKRAMALDPPLIKKDQFRVIYESENFPTAGFGYVCELKPELAEKVKQAFFSFQWKGTGVEKEFAASDQTKFAPVSFKNDFSLVRRIDDAIRTVHAYDMEEAATTEAATAPATQAN